MTAFDPREMALRGRIGAHRLHALHDVMETSAPGRKAAWERFLKEVDPDGVLPEAERERRAKHAQSAHMARIQHLSAKARRKNKAEAR
jgi:hypothetical protein